ncbi:MAG: hypothetical protein IJ741_03570 [Schwartzia sp.]|nr:hypothetical protein [Schwartzia sp. (in: firmicutes)]
MIKSFTPRPFARMNPLPSYVTKVRTYILTALVVGGYKITLAILSIGDSVSAGNPLTHAMFESFSDHGERMSVTRTRVSGCEREFTAVKNAMAGAGVEFDPVAPCESEKMLQALGDWFQGQNPEIQSCSLVSQTCH